MNKIFLSGNLTRDPEQRVVSTQRGENTVTALTIAVNGRSKDDTMFVRVNAWDKLGENCARYLTKGRKVLVTGEARVRAYTNKNNEPGAALEVRASEVEFLNAPAEEHGDAWEPPETVQKVKSNDVLRAAQKQLKEEPNDLPF